MLTHSFIKRKSEQDEGVILVKSYWITWCLLMIFDCSVQVYESIPDVCQAMYTWCVSGLCRVTHGNIFNCNKTVCMTLKAKSAKSTVTPLLTLGVKNVKSLSHYKYLGIVLDTELSDDKHIQRQLRYQYCRENKLQASFSQCSNAVKNVLFCSFCTSMYAEQP